MLEVVIFINYIWSIPPPRMFVLAICERPGSCQSRQYWRWSDGTNSNRIENACLHLDPATNLYVRSLFLVT